MAPPKKKYRKGKGAQQARYQPAFRSRSRSGSPSPSRGAGAGAGGRRSRSRSRSPRRSLSPPPPPPSLRSRSRSPSPHLMPSSPPPLRRSGRGRDWTATPPLDTETLARELMTGPSLSLFDDGLSILGDPDALANVAADVGVDLSADF